MAPLLSVVELSTALETPRGLLRAVDDVSFTLERGRTLGVVGESGSGKSILARSIMRLLPRTADVGPRTQVLLDGEDLMKLSERSLRRLRGPRMAMIFQDPMTSLNPVLTVGAQIRECLTHHFGMSRKAAHDRAIELLAAVGIPQPSIRIDQYPHQLSGGMRQRVAMAIALACEPALLIADEPTTALDVTVQAEILDLLQRQQQERNMAMILITHDLSVVAGRTNDVAVMYAGRIVEKAPTANLFKFARMPYTKALLASIPRLDAERRRRLAAIEGRMPDRIAPLAGCSFEPRCRFADAVCRTMQPIVVGEGSHAYACWHPVLAEANR